MLYVLLLVNSIIAKLTIAENMKSQHERDARSHVIQNTSAPSAPSVPAEMSCMPNSISIAALVVYVF